MSCDLPFTRAVSTVRLAISFSEAAERQVLESRSQPLVTYFLIGHALELAWKSVLIAEGVPEEELRAIGHDLSEVKARAEEILGSGVATTGEVVAVTEMIADYYKAKSFEYVEPGYYSLPEATQALSAVSEYVDALQTWVDQRVRDRRRKGDVPE